MLMANIGAIVLLPSEILQGECAMPADSKAQSATGAAKAAPRKAPPAPKYSASAPSGASANATELASASASAAAVNFSKSVAVIGGGIAGIAAAVKLHLQGFNVTLFEKAAKLGGNLSSNSPDDSNGLQDVYPHIFADWYKEFWYLLEKDLGISRKDHFAPQRTIHMALPPEDHEPERKRFSADTLLEHDIDESAQRQGINAPDLVIVVHHKN